MLSLSTIVTAQDDYVVADRNKPQNPELVDFGLSGFVIKKRDTKGRLYKRGQSSGKGTFFSPNRGSCGWKNSKNDLVVAVNEKDMGNKKKGGRNVNCGRLVEIVNDAGKKVRAKVVDTCPGCGKGDLDLSPAAFIKLAPFSKGVVKIQWKYVN
ncbi:RlpA-like double-psi beta-barrel-protein domain-containing protein-containing protein [Mucor mucedo]|uniref:RlpA-like double-psi beta-barrel-protein domain-containing protein-containing protein n=1 Tax=Mucor mucedo TaxID=29922 RepID=UPI00221F793F|nr:RlpA-like double-psi beta-barrel-protein domain-containing protein-containing protein [Mucor mucedo]KAI7895813.1 RlpA-like double-psi beta-barrel-protein domain-containing protein-containing protein [Mucor mucedo]